MSLLLSRIQLSTLAVTRLGRSYQKPSTSYFSTISDANVADDDGLVLSQVDEDSGVAILAMNRPPANSLNLQMNEAICKSIKDIESNAKIQSVILTSTNPTIFSAGLDVTELLNPDKERLPKFWNSLQQVYLDLYGSRLATISAIQGHAPAAGCFIAMASDYRIMSSGSIGLNETKLGIAAPPWMGQLMVSTIGPRKAEIAMQLGQLFPPKEALEVGLVDEIVVSDEQRESNDALLDLLPTAIKDQASNALMQQAYKQAKVYAKIPPQARVASKLLTRGQYIKDMIQTREQDTDHFFGFVTQEAVQNNLKAYVEALKKKSKKK